MKKTSLLLSLLLAIFISSNAQVVFEENFNTTADGALPANWTRFNVDGLTPYYSWISDSWVSLLVNGTDITTKAAWSTSYYTPAGTANDWMFTPAINIPASNPVLQYTEYTPNSQYPDGYELRIMTSAPTSGTITTSTVLLTVAAASSTPLQKTIDLSAYAGQTVYIGWRNKSNDMLLLAIDDIIVKSKHNNDIAVTEITTPLFVAEGNSNITGAVKNVGLNAITSYDVTYTINNGATSSVYSVTGQNIAIGSTANFTHDVPANFPIGFDTIEVNISNINGALDSNSFDNVLNKIVSSLPDNNISITSINIPSMVGAGNNNVIGTVKNLSVTPITSYDVTYKVDGGTSSAVYSVTVQNIAFEATHNFTHNIPANLTVGTHTIEVTISNVNGATDPDLADNVLIKTITVGSIALPRKLLVEEFSTEACPNCPPVATYLHGIAETDTNIIMMVQHAGYYTDPYTIPENTAMCAMFNDGGSTYAPAGMIDRYYWNADMDENEGVDPGPVFWPGTPYGGNAITARKAFPAFASVNINGFYNPTSRDLSVTVSGTLTANFSNIGISLWVTEDNITTTAQAGATGTWTHHNLVRDAISSTWGDLITTPTTDGSTYTKTYTYKLGATWNISNLSLVAFVNQIDGANVNNRTVYNSNTKKVNQLTVNSISENKSDIDFNVYPNPATDNMRIKLNLSKTNPVNINIFNTMGALVFSSDKGQISSGSHSFDINVHNFAKGIYNLNIQVGENNITKRIVVE